MAGQPRSRRVAVAIALVASGLVPTSAGAGVRDAAPRAALAAAGAATCQGDVDRCGTATGIATGDGFELGLYILGADALPRDVSGGASSCPGCRWEVVPACERNVPGTGSNDLSCPEAVATCDDTGGTYVDVYLKRPGERWRTVNSFCSNPAQPVTTPAQIAEAAAQRFLDMALPQPGLRSQPPGGTAVNLPTVFWGDDTGPVAIDVTLRGFSASLTATPSSWRWDFGDGTSVTTSTPGAPYPHHSVSHAYRARGRVTATATTTWVGTVSVPGIGALPIAEVVTRTSTVVIGVREARTELVSDGRTGS